MDYHQGIDYTNAEIVALTRTYAARLRAAADDMDALDSDAPFGPVHIEADHCARVLGILEFEMVIRGGGL